MPRDDFQVVGYFPTWAADTSRIRFEALTHINYAFAIPTADGGLLPLEHPELAAALITQAHSRGVRVYLSVGGWSWQDIPLEATFVEATETENKRARLTEEIFAMCRSFGFDGADLDWEHPRMENGSWRAYEDLVCRLSARLRQAGLGFTCAVFSGVNADGSIHPDAAAHTDRVLAEVDRIHVMAYDGGDGETHSPYSFAVNAAVYWAGTRHVPREKVILGLPFYARPAWAGYGALLEAHPEARETDCLRLGGVNAWYNGEATIRKKTAYALAHLGGVMIWELSLDAPGESSLQAVIQRECASGETTPLSSPGGTRIAAPQSH